MQFFTGRKAKAHGEKRPRPSKECTVPETDISLDNSSPAIESLSLDPYEYEYLERLRATEVNQQQDRVRHSMSKDQERQMRKKQSTSSSMYFEVSRSQSSQGWYDGIRTIDQRSSSGYLTPASMEENVVPATHHRVAAIVDEVMMRLERDHEDADAAKGLILTQPPASQPKSKSGFIDFKKTWLYANSRLPPFLAPVKFYSATWPIICTAIQASRDAYYDPEKGEREDFVEASWRRDIKAAKLQTRAVDDRNLIVIAIRGTKSHLDWRTNFRLAPVEPVGFLDDEGNACHAGYLQTARAMVAPVAARLRHLLELNPSRSSSSLLLTGHSAGGAVATLLYMHMMATRFKSELNVLTKLFKRVHCVTFGTPPLTLLPLQNPPGHKYKQNIFVMFANEGDPVVRADKQYLSTFYRCIAAPAPLSGAKNSREAKKRASLLSLKPKEEEADSVLPVQWEIPPATLCNPGRIVLLREKPAKRNVVEAVQVTDDDLRGVLFGDPEMHWTDQYQKRIEDLAFAAITGRDER